MATMEEIETALAEMYQRQTNEMIREGAFFTSQFMQYDCLVEGCPTSHDPSHEHPELVK